MAAHTDNYYKLIARLVKSPEDKILYPDQWYDKDIPYLVSGFGHIIPINRIVAMFCDKNHLEKGSMFTSIFWINEYYNPNKKESKKEKVKREEREQIIEENGFERWDEEWWELQKIYNYGGYDLKNRFKIETGWKETICDPRCKNHHLWYLMWNEPSKLQYIEPGDNDVIWGDIGEVDYNYPFL
jgi:hypothetical protein